MSGRRFLPVSSAFFLAAGQAVAWGQLQPSSHWARMAAYPLCRGEGKTEIRGESQFGKLKAED